MSTSKIDPGVYLIRNLINGKVYVGSSIRIGRRKTEHFLRLGKNSGSGNEYLQRAWNKYGKENFSFEILERCSSEDRLRREEYWINKFCATNEKYGYNLIPTRQNQLYGKSLSKYQKAGWAKLSKKERRERNSHLFEPEIRKLAFDRSNEVKSGKGWRSRMEKNAWSKLRLRWLDPEKRAALIKAQNEGKAKSAKYKAYMARGRQ